MDTSKQKNSLWTNDFTIITLGSAVSMLGNSMSGFAMSLLVLDYTKSTFLYAIYIATYTMPQIIVPIFSGAVLDRFSRRKTIYMLDFIASGLFALGAFILHSGWFSFPFLTVFCFLIGSINSIYLVAYESFYPLLITEGNYSKAYSVSSFLETIASIMIPVATYAYNLAGAAPLLAFNAVSFLLAAVMETQITAKEEYIEIQKSTLSKDATYGKQMFTDVKEGIRYLLQEKGLMAVTVYFTILSVAYGASNVITLPYFKSTFHNGEYVYMLVWGMAIVGRGIGSLIHYRFKFPSKYKYNLALIVYVLTALIESFYLYTNIPSMMIMCFLSGIGGVTSYTIRISATQNYVPDEKKGRFNGAFNMLNTSGSFIGDLLAGALTVTFAPRTVLTVFMVINGISALLIIGGNKKSVSEIYNMEI